MTLVELVEYTYRRCGRKCQQILSWQIGGWESPSPCSGSLAQACQVWLYWCELVKIRSISNSSFRLKFSISNVARESAKWGKRGLALGSAQVSSSWLCALSDSMKVFLLKHLSASQSSLLKALLFNLSPCSQAKIFVADLTNWEASCRLVNPDAITDKSIIAPSAWMKFHQFHLPTRAVKNL